MLVNGALALCAAGRVTGITQSTASVADESSLRLFPAIIRRGLRRFIYRCRRRLRRKRWIWRRRITAPYDNAYDKASAVQRYLRENISYDDQD